ncbi:hypothetical protein HYALB_00003057 [Hymenoscyphus albidus]|uniref:Cytochrome P450 n=1 Tax=Hymenoscyphus albidus TaxID=595503 RepID=A0A9N9M1Q8_9HELO|nr:hypothetical protein HYALB_00003057 [Hymenoscyphus albidus]
MAVFVFGVFLVAFAVISYLSQRSKIGKSSFRQFPGPYQLPYIGRIHDLPVKYMWLKFFEWGREYGPVYRTSMMGDNFIIITDEKVAEELLVKRAKIYSDRPAFTSLFDSKGNDGPEGHLPLLGKNKYWSRQRRLSHSYLIDARNKFYNGIMNHEAKRFLYRLVNDPDNFSNHLENMASKVACEMAYDDSSSSTELTQHSLRLLTQISPAGPITNLATPLWNLPLCVNPWKRAEIKRHDEERKFWKGVMANARAKWEKGESRNCFARKYFESQTNLSGDGEAACVFGMVALMSIFTVGGPLHYFLMAMVLHPEWLRKCQEEIDEQCGGKMPTLADCPRLPILRSCILETMRWRPNIPTGVAHEVEEDDWYDDCFIAKGSRILPLEWAFLRNPEKYPDPENYHPERYLSSDWPTYREPLSIYPNMKTFTSFGWGQRRCMGQSQTQDELLIACGALCWGYNLKNKIDVVTGKAIEIDTESSNSLLIMKPSPFEMTFEPRSEKRREVMIEQWRYAEQKDMEAREDFLRMARREKSFMTARSTMLNL